MIFSIVLAQTSPDLNTISYWSEEFLVKQDRTEGRPINQYIFLHIEQWCSSVKVNKPNFGHNGIRNFFRVCLPINCSLFTSKRHSVSLEFKWYATQFRSFWIIPKFLRRLKNVAWISAYSFWWSKASNFISSLIHLYLGVRRENPRYWSTHNKFFYQKRSHHKYLKTCEKS